jgi:ACS family glucarate transporter-like MFS transporter
MEHAASQTGPSATRVWLRYAVLTWLCAAATLAYVQRQSLAVAEKTIRADLGMEAEHKAWVQSAFFISYALLQIPTGRIAQGLGTRIAMPVFAVFFSVCCAACGAAQGAAGFIVARLGMGTGQAGIFPASTNSIARWFPRTELALASGGLAAFMQVGGALGAVLTGELLQPVGWRWLFVLYSLPALVWAVGFYGWFRDTPEEHSARREEPPAAPDKQASGAAHARSRGVPWWTLITSRAMLCICTQQFCRASGSVFFASWFATYLRETRGVSIPGSGWLTGLPVMATAVGCLVGGGVSDWILVRSGSRRLARKWLAVTCMGGCAALTASAYGIQDALVAVALISAGTLVASFAAPCAYAITIDMGGDHRVAVFSTMNMWGNIGAAVFPHLVPPLVRATGSWDLVLFLFAGMYLTAGVFWLLLDPSGTVFDRRENGA